jgi:hypothetical protein
MDEGLGIEGWGLVYEEKLRMGVHNSDCCFISSVLHQNHTQTYWTLRLQN